MPLKKNNQPKNLFPRAVWIDPRRYITLNAVGLSGPGAEAVFEKLKGVSYRFQPSIMAVEDQPEERGEEINRMMELMDQYLPIELTPVVQVNVSCPNVGLHGSSGHIEEKVNEIRNTLDIIGIFGRSAVIKLSAEFPPEKVREFDGHPTLFGVCVTNTIPYRGDIPWLLENSELQIPWDNIFGIGAPSPLRARGLDADGGFSGPHLRGLTCEWIKRVRLAGTSIHINGGGGIYHAKHVDLFREAGADSIFVGSVVYLNPGQVQPIAQRAEEVFG